LRKSGRNTCFYENSLYNKIKGTAIKKLSRHKITFVVNFINSDTGT